jgi:RNA polymerase sigma-70 factor (ECF subfamily)
LPEPRVSAHGDLDSFDKFEEEESISMAFLVLLEQLTPLARAVFLLREVFDYEYREIAEIVERDEAACRQIFSRSKKELARGQRRFQPSAAEHRRIVSSFMQAANHGDMRGLTALLTDDVGLWADGGGKVRGAATRPIHGRADVSKFVISSRRFVAAADTTFDLATVNAGPGVILRAAGKPIVVMSFDFENGQICGVRLVANPDKLRHVDTVAR